MSRQLRRLTGGGVSGTFVGGTPATADRLTLVRATAVKETLDLLMLGGLGRNQLAGGDLVTGIDASASGDIDLLNWCPLKVDNTSNQFSAFTDANGATLVVQVRFLLRVSNAAITLTPKVLYGISITTVSSVATLTGALSSAGTATDFSGSNQYQEIAMALPAGVNCFKPQVTIGGTPAAGYQAWAKAFLDVYVQS